MLAPSSSADTVCDRLPDGFSFPPAPSPEVVTTVTMCAWTRRFRLAERWVTVEEFLWERYRVRVSHGISEDGIRLMGDMTKSVR